MVIPKFILNSTKLIPSCHLRYVNYRIMFRKGGNNKSFANGATGPIDEDNLSVPKRWHRKYLQQDEVNFINSGGASMYDVPPKNVNNKSKAGGSKAPHVIDNCKGALDEENMDVPKRNHRLLLQQVEVDVVNTGGASNYDLVPKVGGKKSLAAGNAKGKK